MNNIYMWKRQHPVLWDLILTGTQWAVAKLQEEEYSSETWTDKEIVDYAAAFIEDQNLINSIHQWEDETPESMDVTRYVIPKISDYVYQKYVDEVPYI